jgi:hypothetical protein
VCECVCETASACVCVCARVWKLFVDCHWQGCSFLDLSGLAGGLVWLVGSEYLVVSARENSCAETMAAPVTQFTQTINVRILDMHGLTETVELNATTTGGTLCQQISTKLRLNPSLVKYYSVFMILSTLNEAGTANVHTLRTVASYEHILTVFDRVMGKQQQMQQQNSTNSSSSNSPRATCRWYFKDTRTAPIDNNDFGDLSGDSDSDDEVPLSTADFNYLNKAERKGYLFRKSSRDPNLWRKRLCLLTDKLWCINDKKQSLRAMSLLLNNATNASNSNESNLPMMNIPFPVTVTTGSRTHYFRASSASDSVSWCTDIYKAGYHAEDNSFIQLAEVIMGDEESIIACRKEAMCASVVDSELFSTVMMAHDFFSYHHDNTSHMGNGGSKGDLPLGWDADEIYRCIMNTSSDDDDSDEDKPADECTNSKKKRAARRKQKAADSGNNSDDDSDSRDGDDGDSDEHNGNDDHDSDDDEVFRTPARQGKSNRSLAEAHHGSIENIAALASSNPSSNARNNEPSRVRMQDSARSQTATHANANSLTNPRLKHSTSFSSPYSSNSIAGYVIMSTTLRHCHPTQATCYAADFPSGVAVVSSLVSSSPANAQSSVGKGLRHQQLPPQPAAPSSSSVNIFTHVSNPQTPTTLTKLRTRKLLTYNSLSHYLHTQHHPLAMVLQFLSEVSKFRGLFRYDSTLPVKQLWIVAMQIFNKFLTPVLNREEANSTKSGAKAHESTPGTEDRNQAEQSESAQKHLAHVVGAPSNEAKRGNSRAQISFANAIKSIVNASSVNKPAAPSAATPTKTSRSANGRKSKEGKNVSVKLEVDPELLEDGIWDLSHEKIMSVHDVIFNNIRSCAVNPTAHPHSNGATTGTQDARSRSLSRSTSTRTTSNGTPTNTTRSRANTAAATTSSWWWSRSSAANITPVNSPAGGNVMATVSGDASDGSPSKLYQDVVDPVLDAEATELYINSFVNFKPSMTLDPDRTSCFYEFIDVITGPEITLFDDIVEDLKFLVERSNHMVKTLWKQTEDRLMYKLYTSKDETLRKNLLGATRNLRGPALDTAAQHAATSVPASSSAAAAGNKPTSPSQTPSGGNASAKRRGSGRTSFSPREGEAGVSRHTVVVEWSDLETALDAAQSTGSGPASAPGAAIDADASEELSSRLSVNTSSNKKSVPRRLTNSDDELSNDINNDLIVNEILDSNDDTGHQLSTPVEIMSPIIHESHSTDSVSGFFDAFVQHDKEEDMYASNSGPDDRSEDGLQFMDPVDLMLQDEDDNNNVNDGDIAVPGGHDSIDELERYSVIE